MSSLPSRAIYILFYLYLCSTIEKVALTHWNIIFFVEQIEMFHESEKWKNIYIFHRDIVE
jgi:hypothetical protein